MDVYEFWNEEFGNRAEAKDFAGRLVRKNEHGQKSDHGWTLDHILPEDENGPNTWDNVQITHWKTNEEKANKIAFKANGKSYQVKRMGRLSEEDRVANYPYNRRHRKHCVVLMD